MFDLPITTEYNKKIPKQRFYENLSVSPALKRLFVEQIQSIVWANKIAPSTVNVAVGKEVTEIEVFRISLTTDILSEEVLLQMDKQIPYHIVFILENKSNYQLWIGFKESITTGSNNAFKVNKYFHTDWLAEQDLHIRLNGMDMDSVYENLVRHFGNIDIRGNNSLSEQIAADEQRTKIEKEIELLTKKMNAEKQPNKKLELLQNIKNLKKCGGYYEE